ncbi:hypothetical protein HanPI659440_Chr07g0255121 [Helianthus annuus]|nr:hypothetical protein HanPI659440_Chr07g0255121 [Helianthus annuus]
MTRTTTTGAPRKPEIIRRSSIMLKQPIIPLRSRSGLQILIKQSKNKDIKLIIRHRWSSFLLLHNLQQTSVILLRILRRRSGFVIVSFRRPTGLRYLNRNIFVT